MRFGQSLWTWAQARRLSRGVLTPGADQQNGRLRFGKPAIEVVIPELSRGLSAHGLAVFAVIADGIWYLASR